MPNVSTTDLNLLSILGCEPIRIQASMNCFRKICHLWDKGHFAAGGTITIFFKLLFHPY